MATDINYDDHTFPGTDGLVLQTHDVQLSPEESAKYNDLLKFSKTTNCKVGKISVTGGQQIENAIDMNNECANISLGDVYLEEGRENALTIKGGCDNIYIGNLVIKPGIGHCDIELGNWSDQSKKKTTNVVIGRVARTDGKPVRVRYGWADKPVIHDGNVEWQTLQGLLIRLWVWFRITVSP